MVGWLVDGAAAMLQHFSANEVPSRRAPSPLVVEPADEKASLQSLEPSDPGLLMPNNVGTTGREREREKRFF